MAQEKRVTWIPRRGRGLVSAFSPHNMGELWDSFAEFRHIIIDNGAWVQRPGDSYQYTRTNQVDKHLHIFNQMDTEGAVTSKLIHLLSTGGIHVDQAVGAIYNTVSPFEVFFATVKNRLFFTGINQNPKVWDGTTLASWGADGPVGALVYDQFAIDSANSLVEAGTYTAAGTTITRTSGTNFTTGAAWEGKTFIGEDGVEYTIATVTDVSNLELTIPFTGPNGDYLIRYGDRSWSDPPKYAYAYYNPTTGHVTNICPVLTLSEKDINNVAVFISAIATNATLNGYGYTKIVLFRTARDGSDLFPLKCQSGGTGSASVDVNGLITNSGGPLSYQDNDGQDLNLGQVLGIKLGPTQNNKCPNLRFFAYWDGRFFGITEEFAWRERFSGDLAQIELGVAEESWPDANYRDLNATDDQMATGVGVVGTSLLTSTLRQAYYMSGRDEGNYRPERLSTRGFGVNQYSLAEHPGDGSAATASAIYISRDRRVWRHREGGVITDIGSPIQDKLDAGGTLDCARPYMVKVIRAGKMWLVVVGIAQGGLPMQLYFYDVDQECWYDFNLRDVTALDSNIIETIMDSVTLFAAGTQSSQIWWLMGVGTAYAGGETTGYLRTQHVDAGDRTAKKEMSEFVLYVSTAASAASWAVSGVFDENVPFSLEFVATEDSPRHAGEKVLRYVYKGVYQWHSAQFTVLFPFIGAKLFRMDCILKPASTGTSGSPS